MKNLIVDICISNLNYDYFKIKVLIDQLNTIVTFWDKLYIETKVDTVRIKSFQNEIWMID